MKTTKEIADTVFRRRDAYFAQQRARNRTIRQAAVIGTSVCGCGILAFSGLHFRKVREPIPSITPAEGTATQQTSTTWMTTLTQTTQTTTQTVRHTETTQAATQNTTAFTEGSSALQTTALTTAMPPESATTVQTQITTQPIMTTETITYQTAAAGIVEPTPIVTETQPVTTKPVTETTAQPETRQFDGFRVEQYPDCQKIICTDEFPVPDGELVPYLMLSDEYTVLSMSEPEAPEPERSYEIECAEAGKVFTVTQREYAAFALTVDEGELIDIGLNRAHGFFHLQGEVCSLYWFRDGEGFFVSGDASDLKYLMTIARSFTPAGEIK